MYKHSLFMSAAALAFVAMNAHAAEGTITFTGSVVASTCKINGGANDLTVPLPRAATNQLATVGATAGRTPFTLALSGCTTDKKGEDGETVIAAPVKKVSVAFEPGPNVDLGSGRLKITGADAATGVQIGILNDKYEPIKIGAESSTQGVQIADIDTAIGGAGTATLQFAAQYVATGPVTGGSANSFVTYSLTYP